MLAEDHSANPVHPLNFRRVLGHLATGVSVITGEGLDGPVGVSCNSLTSVSLEPALVAFCAAHESTTWPRIRAAGRFCVNVLAEDQEDVCRLFAAKGVDRFGQIGWRPAPSGAPVLADALAWIDCAIDAEHDAGDHTIVVGRVIELRVGEESEGPLLFYRGGYGRFLA